MNGQVLSNTRNEDQQTRPVLPHLLPRLSKIHAFMARMKPFKDLQCRWLLQKMRLDVDWA